ncbi:hypothetical protein [Arthrobacter rhizosphaerae]|uniref:hypothetical protein n=1 Tax=Arthrobacter rhizosphaerae TaxID=2855490 RepID=UPI001FF4FAF6|nr:hypothetical protein [Arthrobacter rhizosphaerae]
MGEMQLMDRRLAEIAQELYGLPLEEFVAARTASAKSAAEEDRELAAAVRGLPKPSSAAWAVNMFARHDPDSVRQLSELGQSMRAAQDNLDAAAMRELGQERRRLLSEVMEIVHSVAKQRGRKISGAVATEVEGTLRAATADSGAAAAVRSGQLLKVLSSDGVDQVDLDGAVAVPQMLADALQNETRKEGTDRRRREPEKTTDAGQRSDKPSIKDRAQESGRESQKGNAKRAAGQTDKPRLQAVEPMRRPALPSALEKALASLAEAEAVTRAADKDAAATENRLEELEAEVGRLAERSRKLREELKNLDRELDRVRKERETAAIEAQQASRAADKGRRTEELARQRVLRLRNTQN